MKIIQTILLLLASVLSGRAQQTLSSKDMIAITPLVSTELPVADGVKKILELKARQMLTMNGLASYSERFVLTPNITILTKEATPTAPPMFSISMEISFYVVDVFDQTIISEIVFPGKGIDQQEHKALIQAINRINPRSEKVSAFIEETKNRITDYYKMRIPTLSKQAETLAAQGFYEDALNLLAGVPESVEGYPAIANKTKIIYKQYANHQAAQLLKEAKGHIAIREYPAAIELLADISPLSDRYKTATSLINSIKSSIDASERAAITSQMQHYEAKQEEARRIHDDEVALQKMAINASRDIAIANNEANKPSLMKSINNWFISKFN